jgi:hypothetical protein
MMTGLLTLRKKRRFRRRCWRLVLCRPVLLCWPILLFGPVLLAGNIGHAAEVGDPRLRGSAAEQTEQNIEALLQKAEQQIRSGHTMAPPGDCAVDTWARVIQAVRTADPDHARTALTGFATNARSRAARETSAGNVIVGGDLTVFADQANGLLARPAEAAEPVAAKRAAAEAALTFEPLAGSLPPIPRPEAAQSNTPGKAAAALPPSAVRAVVAEFYTARADHLLAVRDLPEARKFYEYAVNAGSARAAATLARTYDAKFVARTAAELRQHSPERTRGHRGRLSRTRTQATVAPAAADAGPAAPPVAGNRP